MSSQQQKQQTAADVENFRLSQLGDFGIVVNPQWTVPTLQAEDLYLISLDAILKLINPATAKKKNASKAEAAEQTAVLNWISENSANHSAETVYNQAVSDIQSLPKKLPTDSKERFDACSTLSQLLKSIVGVPDHLDYSVFMYPNEKKNRDLVSALLERLGDHQDRVRAQTQQGSSSKSAASSSSAAAVSGGQELSIASIFASRAKSGPVVETEAFAAPVPRRVIKTARNKAMTSLKKSDLVVSTSLHENSLRRFKAMKMSCGAGHNNNQRDAPEWVVTYLKSIGKFSENNGKKGAAGAKSAADLMYGSLADVAPQQAAAQEREAAELQARLRNQQADVEKMKLSVEDAQKARELEDEDLSEKLKSLKSGIKHFKNRIKSAKGEMEDLEKEFVNLENTEADDLARLEQQIADVAARRAIIDGVDKGAEEFVASLQAQLDEVEAEHTELLNDIESKLNKQRKKQRSLRDKIASMGPTKQEQLIVLQADCKKLLAECRTKLDEFESLEAELERSRSKTKIMLDRDVLSKMVYEVTVRRHAKQEEQIQELVNEIGLSDRRIDDLSTAISKRYGEIESEMYATAKTDAAIRDLFPPLVGLRGEYVTLVKRIGELGVVRKETHDFESRLNKLMRFSDSSMLASAENDLRLVNESVKSVQKELSKLQQSAGGNTTGSETAGGDDDI